MSVLRPEQHVGIHDAVLLILVLAAERAKQTQAVFIGSSSHIHTAFWAASQRFPRILNTLLFDTNGNYPHSENLEQILFALKLAGLINTSLSAPPKLLILSETVTSVKQGHERAVRRALPNLDEIVDFMCNPDNPYNLLLPNSVLVPAF